MEIALGNTRYFDGRTDALVGPEVRILAVGDLNGDGIKDLVLQAERAGSELSALRVALGRASGGFLEAQMFAAGSPQVSEAHVLIGDFTGDGRPDLAVYDAGYYDWAVRLTIGRIPVLYVGGTDGKLTATAAFADAIQPLVSPGPFRGGTQTDLTMGVKDVDAADIDGDGDLDLWVESTGSANITGHFMINEGGGRFRIDLQQKITREMYNGPGANYWRYGHSEFLDLNQDGAQDLVVLQIRDNQPTHLTQSSFVYLNDGRGNFPAASVLRLPLPDFYYGYTSANAADSWDINGDGRKDLVLVHTRNDDVSGSAVEPAWTGNYIQVLMQAANGQFTDETQSRMGDQGAWSNNALAPFMYARRMTHADVNRDGIMDMILGYKHTRPSTDTPVIFLGRADGSFFPADPALLTGGDPYFGEGIWAADLNGDSFIDFIHSDSSPGPNGTYEQQGGDDFSVLVSQVSSGPLGGAPPLWSPRIIEGTRGSDALAGSLGNDRLVGWAGSDRLDGGAGVDISVYALARAAYVVTPSGGNVSVANAMDGTDTLLNIERLQFSDTRLALDVAGGNAGTVAKVMGVVFGPAAVANKEYIGIGLGFLDAGTSYPDLVAIALGARLGAAAGNAAVVQLLYTNLTGAAPSATELAFYKDMLDSAALTQTQLGQIAADHVLNVSNINLVGLAQSGIEYA